jgi:hypothetical protein
MFSGGVGGMSLDRCDVCIGGILRTMFSGGVGGMSLWIDVMFVLEVY